MKTNLPLRATLAALVLLGVALMAAAPSAAAEPTRAGCDQTPLGEPDPENPGLDDHIKTFGNPVIYGACTLVLTVAGEIIVLAGDVIVLVIDAANLVCKFATGNPCPTTQVLEDIRVLVDGGQ